MTASQKPKTPSMTMKVRPNTPPSAINSFCKRASRLTLSHIVDKVTVTEQLVLKGESRSKEFKIDLEFYPRPEYEEEYNVTPFEIMAAFATKFPLIFKKELQVELKKLDADLKSQRTELGKGRAVREPTGQAAADEEEGEDTGNRRRDDDDVTSEIGDGDATTSKMKRQRKEQATYDEDDEDEEDADEGGELDDMDIEAAYASYPEDDVDTDQATPMSEAEHSRVESLFMDNLPSATSFEFRDARCTIGLQVRLLCCVLSGLAIDDSAQFGSTLPKLLLVGLVERVCLKTVVREIPGITDCFMNEEDGKNKEKIYSVGHHGARHYDESTYAVHISSSRQMGQIFRDCGSTRSISATASSTRMASTPTTSTRYFVLTASRPPVLPSCARSVASSLCTRSTSTFVTWSLSPIIWCVIPVTLK